VKSRRQSGFLWVAVGLCAWLVALAPSRADEPQALSGSGTVAVSPRIASAANGDCAVVWQERGSAGRPDRIVTRSRQGGSWGAARGLSRCEPASARDPVIALDSGGKPHAVWVVEQDGHTRLHYSFVTVSRWVAPRPLTPDTPHRIQRPQLAIGPGGEVFVTWQESEGSDYQIHAMVIDASGRRHHDVLEGAERMCFAIYPDLVLLPPDDQGAARRMAVCWYNLEGDQARLEMRVWMWNAWRRSWSRYQRPQWAPELLQSLPLVAATESEGLLLVGHRSAGRLDRVFLSSERFPLAYLDNTPLAQSRFPRVGRSADGTVGLVWQQETDQGAALMQAALRPSGEIFASRLADMDPCVPPQPDAALGADSLMVVWAAPADGASPGPAVWFAETALADPPWRALTPAP